MPTMTVLGKHKIESHGTILERLTFCNGLIQADRLYKKKLSIRTILENYLAEYEESEYHTAFPSTGYQTVVT